MPLSKRGEKQNMILNDSQKEAVLHTDGPALIVAGPGSGKTAVITARILYLIRKAKVPAQDILAVTFSKKAAENMKERFLDQYRGQGLPFFGTFHSIFFMILRYAYNLTTANIVSEVQKRNIILQAAEELNLEYEDSTEFASAVLSEISTVKSGSKSIEGFTSNEVSPAEFRRLYKTYADALSDSGQIDFDDMLSMCFKLLNEREDIRTYWQRRFRYILVDEFQDINPIQYQIICLLAAPQNNLFVVGDDDQSIYAFRGSSPKIMHAFLKDYPDASKIVLSRSYRCPLPILNSAQKVIRENKGRLPKQLSSEKQSRNGVFQIRKCKTQEGEYESIAADIEKRILSGTAPSEIAILTRTSLKFPFLVQILNNHGLEVEATPPLSDVQEHFILRDLNAYLRLADSYRGQSIPAAQVKGDFLRILNKPSRYIAKKFLQQAFTEVEVRYEEELNAENVLDALKKVFRKDRQKREEIDSLEYHFRMLGKSTPYARIEYICTAIGYESYLKDYAEEFHGNYSYYQTILDSVRAKYLPSVTEKNNKRHWSQTTSRICLLTIHAAKGLEFKHVYIPDVNEDLLPVRKARGKTALEEERRIFYVAMTRASETLKIYFAETVRNKKTAPSRFLDCFLKKSI